MERWLALELAVTIRHDGNGGVADDLETGESVADWVRARADLLEPGVGAAVSAASPADERVRREVVGVRTAVRALLARAVSPAPPSRADAGRLPAAGDALEQLNKTVARVPATVTLDWPEDDVPRVVMTGAHRDPVVLLTAALARDAMAFLTHPDSHRLAACTAPRCVRYFLKKHGRQEYCKPSCSNRARVARHYQRQRAHAEQVGGEG